MHGSSNDTRPHEPCVSQVVFRKFSPMARKVDVDDLVSAQEIADRFGLAHEHAVSNWARRHADFPVPIKKLQRVRIWHWPDIVVWAKATGRMDADGKPITPSTDPTRKTKHAEK